MPRLHFGRSVIKFTCPVRAGGGEGGGGGDPRVYPTLPCVRRKPRGCRRRQRTAPQRATAAGRPARRWPGSGSRRPRREGSSSGLDGPAISAEAGRAAPGRPPPSRAEPGSLRCTPPAPLPEVSAPCPPGAVPGRVLAPLGAGLRGSRCHRASPAGPAGGSRAAARPARRLRARPATGRCRQVTAAAVKRRLGSRRHTRRGGYSRPAGQTSASTRG